MGVPAGSGCYSASVGRSADVCRTAGFPAVGASACGSEFGSAAGSRCSPALESYCVSVSGCTCATRQGWLALPAPSGAPTASLDGFGNRDCCGPPASVSFSANRASKPTHVVACAIHADLQSFEKDHCSAGHARGLVQKLGGPEPSCTCTTPPPRSRARAVCSLIQSRWSGTVRGQNGLRPWRNCIVECR